MDAHGGGPGDGGSGGTGNEGRKQDEGKQEGPEQNPDTRHQILALTGGGFRGLFTIEFLRHCEEHWKVDWRQRFSLFAGTSVGSLLAAGLSVGRRAAEIQEAMTTHGPTIFPPRRLHFLRRLVGPAPFAVEPLKNAVESVLGVRKDVLLSEFEGKLVVTAVNYTTGTHEVFCSAGVDPEAAQKVKLVDAILASAAAPTYFPLRMIGDYEYADGGLIANAPDLVAYLTAIGQQRAEPTNCYMLSLGTASWKEGGVALRETADKPGILAALKRRQLVQTIMAAQESLAKSQAAALMGKRHLRIDRAPDEAQIDTIRDMDNADKDAKAALLAMADQEWRRWRREQLEKHDERLRDFFAR